MTHDVWTLTEELLNMSETRCMRDAFHALGLGSCSPTMEFRVLQDWKSVGSESYTFVFKVANNDDRNGTYLLKAFTPSIGTRTPTDAMHHHLEVSQLLGTAGIRTPKVYGYSRATILMEYVPYDLYALARTASKPETALDAALDSLIKLFALGYEPIRGSTDLRTTGEDAYLVDLGTDLGSRSATRVGTISDMRRKALEEIWIGLTRVGLTSTTRRWYSYTSGRGS